MTGDHTQNTIYRFAIQPVSPQIHSLFSCCGMWSRMQFTLLLVAWQAHAVKYQRFCYLASWARYRADPVAFNPEDVGVNLCTHLAYAFANVDDSGTKLISADLWSDPVMYKRFTNLKKKDPNLKLLVSVGGWDGNPKVFSSLVSTDKNINTFAGNAINFLRSRNFDGLDVDWEFPAARGSSPSDRQRFTRMIQLIRQAFNTDASRTGKDRLLLTAALSPDPFRVSLSYEPAKLASYLDLISLMTYDMHGHWEEMKTPAHHSALYGTPTDVINNVAFAATFWTRLGVPRDKILLGLPFYGRTYTLSGGTVTGPGNAGNYTRHSGTLAYYEVCKILQDGATGQRIDAQKVPFLVSKNQWVGYDDEKSLAAKVKYVIDNGFGGVMVWALDMDDFKSICGKAFPLMNAVKNAFGTMTGQRTGFPSLG
ncbi:chitinase-3-like protein 1 [Haliotis rufescens]|uniref:chitinase-3-like protein 1 n=1 Tax=Haliotis rufescens TaxID=6454 RepID=UPI00201E7A7D|nr:chitinase-3-like protein 1 [Haliotis rufescens]